MSVAWDRGGNIQPQLSSGSESRRHNQRAQSDLGLGTTLEAWIVIITFSECQETQDCHKLKLFRLWWIFSSYHSFSIYVFLSMYCRTPWHCVTNLWPRPASCCVTLPRLWGHVTEAIISDVSSEGWWGEGQTADLVILWQIVTNPCNIIVFWILENTQK